MHFFACIYFKVDIDIGVERKCAELKMFSICIALQSDEKNWTQLFENFTFDFLFRFLTYVCV